MFYTCKSQEIHSEHIRKFHVIAKSHCFQNGAWGFFQRPLRVCPYLV